MGLVVEFNDILALRKTGTKGREPTECLPAKLEVGQIHGFLKSGQRNYVLTRDISLVETRGDRNVSEPLGEVRILEATHHLVKSMIYTKGRYEIRRVS